MEYTTGRIVKKKTYRNEIRFSKERKGSRTETSKKQANPLKPERIWGGKDTIN